MPPVTQAVAKQPPRPRASQDPGESRENPESRALRDHRALPAHQAPRAIPELLELLGTTGPKAFKGSKATKAQLGPPVKAWSVQWSHQAATAHRGVPTSKFKAPEPKPTPAMA